MNKNFVCTKCGSVNLFTKNNGTQTGLYCADCGKWIKWLNKEDIRIFEHTISKIATPISLEKKTDLTDFIDGLIIFLQSYNDKLKKVYIK